MRLNKEKITYFGLPRSVYVIFIARVVNSMGNFVTPFMTLLFTQKGGMPEAQVGKYLLMASLLQIPGSLIGGKLTDLMGRKKIMILFMGLSASCFLPAALLIDNPNTFHIIAYLLILSSFFGSISHPASGAMMNDLTVPENRQAAFSLLYMGMNVGAAIGSVVAGFLFRNHMKLLFFGDVITTLIAILLLVRFVKETKPAKENFAELEGERVNERAESGGLLAALLRRPALLVFALLDTIYSFIYAQTSFSLPLKANAVFGDALGPGYYGTLNMVNCLEVIAFTTIITLMTRKIRAVYNVCIAGIFYAVGFGMLFFVDSFWLFLLSTVIWTVGEIINATNIGVYIANHTPISHRGRFQSIISIITGTGSAISPYLMGKFIESYGVNNVWPVIFFLALAASFFMFLLGSHEKRKLKGRAA